MSRRAEPHGHHVALVRPSPAGDFDGDSLRAHPASSAQLAAGVLLAAHARAENAKATGSPTTTPILVRRQLGVLPSSIPNGATPSEIGGSTAVEAGIGLRCRRRLGRAGRRNAQPFPAPHQPNLRGAGATARILTSRGARAPGGGLSCEHSLTCERRWAKRRAFSDASVDEHCVGGQLSGGASPADSRQRRLSRQTREVLGWPRPRRTAANLRERAAGARLRPGEASTSVRSPDQAAFDFLSRRSLRIAFQQRRACRRSRPAWWPRRGCDQALLASDSCKPARPLQLSRS